MAPTPDIRVRLTPEGLNEIVAMLAKVRSESKRTGEGAAQGFVSFRKALEGVRGVLGALGVAVGLVEAIRGLKDLLETSSELTRELADAKEQLGGSTSGVVALAAAARITETDLSKLKTGVVSLAQAVKAMRNGEVTPGTEALRQLGLTAQQFKGQSLSQQLALVASRLAGVADGGTKATLAADIFGRKVGLELIPLLNFLGREGLEGARRQLETLFSPQAIANVTEMRQAFALLDFQIKGLAVQFLSGLAPAVSAALAQISRDLTGASADSVSGWGEVWGKVIATLLVRFDGLVDHLTNGLRVLKALLSDRNLPFGGEARDVDQQLERLAQDRQKRDEQRAQLLEQIKTGTVPKAQVTGDAGADVEDVSQQSKRRLEIAKAEAAAELEVAKALRKAADAVNKDSFDRSLESVRAYYAERRRIQREEFEAELRAARQQADDEVSALKSQRDAEVAAAEARVRTATTAPLNDPAAQARIASPEGAAEAQRALADLQTTQRQFDAEISAAQDRRAEKSKQLALTEKRLTIENESTQRQIDNEETVSLQELTEKRIALENRVAQLRGDHHRQTLIDEDAELKKADELAVRAGAALGKGIAGPPIPLELLDADQRAVLALIDSLHQALDDSAAFADKAREAQTAQQGLDAQRAAIQDQVSAGLKSQVDANRELITLDTDRAAKLRELADELRALAGDNPDFAQQATEFERQARQIELRVQAAQDVTRQFTVALKDAATSGLADFLTNGIGQANGFRDAILGVVNALRQFLSQMLAARIIGGLSQFFGGGTSTSGGGSFTPRLEQVRARGGIVHEQRFAGGGLVHFRGPGTSTSDSIPTYVRPNTFIVRASSARIPANVRRLRELIAMAGATVVRSLGPRGLVPIRVSNGEIGVPPEVMRHPALRAEVEAINRGARSIRVREPRFAEGGMVGAGPAIAAGVAGPAGAAGADGSIARVELTHSEAFLAKWVESYFQGPRGPMIVVQAAARKPKTLKRVIGQ